MSAKIINGKEIAAAVKAEARAEAALCAEKGGRAPALAVVLVGEDPASQVYVKNKGKACAETGITSLEYRLPAETTQEELLSLVEKLNADDGVDGVLVQLPLPGHLDEKPVLDAISPDKDVDGFHPLNAGRLFAGSPVFAPCTPAGILRLLDEAGVELRGAHAVVIGRSNIVGKPVAALLLSRDATVTVCHSKTKNIAEITKTADVVVVAVGKRHFLTSDMVKPGATVIDVGIHRDENGKLSGDADTEALLDVAGAITPVPGGVGPMTIAMLMKNTVKAARLHLSLA